MNGVEVIVIGLKISQMENVCKAWSGRHKERIEKRGVKYLLRGIDNLKHGMKTNHMENC